MYTAQGVEQVIDVRGLPEVLICKALWASFGKEKRYIRTAYYWGFGRIYYIALSHKLSLIYHVLNQDVKAHEPPLRSVDLVIGFYEWRYIRCNSFDHITNRLQKAIDITNCKTVYVAGDLNFLK